MWSLVESRNSWIRSKVRPRLFSLPERDGRAPARGNEFSRTLQSHERISVVLVVWGWGEFFSFFLFFFFRLFHGRCHFGTKKVGPVTEHYTGIVVGSPQYTDADRQSERGRCDVVNPRSIRFNLCTRRCDTFRAFVSSEYSADVRFPIACWLQQLAQRTHLRLVN